MKDAAPSLGIALQIQDVRTGDDLPAAFEAWSQGHVEGLLTSAERCSLSTRTKAELCGPLPFARDLTVIGALRRCGGLMAYGDKLSRLFRRAADLVDRILRGRQAF